LTELLNRLKTDRVGENLITKLFEIEFERKEKCTESDEATESVTIDTRLTCYVNKNISHLIFGLQGGLDTDLEKRSDTLNRIAIWKREDRIKSLPQFLCINMSRFQWKQTDDGGVNCKQLRKVAFPHKLDVSTICCEELKSRMMKYRQDKIDWEDAVREKKQSEGLGLENENKDEKKEDAKPDAVMEEEVQAADAPAEQPAEMMEVEEAAEEEKIEVEKLPNETGEYELIGVVTHKGRGANSGHYIGYSKNLKTNRWMKFDDDIVTEVKDQDIEALYGGGDFQMGYICFYKKIPPTELTPVS